MEPTLKAATYKDGNKYVQEAKQRYGPGWKQVIWERKGGQGPPKLFESTRNKHMGTGPVKVEVPSVGHATKIARALNRQKRKTAAAKRGLVSRGLRHAWGATVGGTKLAPGMVPVSHELGKLVKNPIRTLSSGWKGMGMGERAMMGYFTGQELGDSFKPHPTKTTTNRLGRTLGGAAGWLAFRKSPMLGQIIGTMGTSYAGGKAAEGLKHLFTKKTPGGR